MSFFKHMNFARALILVCLMASGALAYTGWKQYEEIQANGAALAKGGRYEDLTRRVQQSARTYTQLVRERDAEGLVGQENPESYIRKAAFHVSAQLGEVNITPIDRPRGNFVDHTYRIVPADKEAEFSRTAVANFLYMLEADSHRVRVTDLGIQVAGVGRRDPAAIPKDRWSFDVEVTTRARQ